MGNKSIKLTTREALITSNYRAQLSTTTYCDGNQDSGFRQVQHLAVPDHFIGIKPLLDYWIASDNSDINKS